MNREELIEKVIQLNKDGEKNKQKYQEVIDLLTDEILDLEKSDVLYAEKSLAYYRIQKYTETKIEADRALQINPNNSKALSILGGYYYSFKKENDKAEEYYKEATIKDSENPLAYAGLGNLYHNQKDYQKAEEFYLKAILRNPEYANAYNGLGNLYFDQKNNRKAEECYKKAIDKNSEFVNPYNGLGNLYLIQKDYKKAEEYYLKAILKDPEYVNAYNGLGNLYHDQKDYDEAEKFYLNAIEKDPEFVNAYNGLGNLYRDQKENVKAEEYFNEAIKKNSESAHAYNGLGILYYDKKDYKKAEEYYIKAIQKDPEIDAPYYNLGLLYYIGSETRQIKKAKDNFQKFISVANLTLDEYKKIAKKFVKEIDDILNSPELNKIVSSKDKIRNILKFNDGEISHFTSLSTVKYLVIDDSLFRLSEATFLNDSSEGKTLFNFLEYSQETNSNIGHEYTFAKKPFIGSFVHAGKHNDLALWRLYGKEGSEEGKGCSITLNSTVFLQIIKDNASEATKQNFDNEFQLYKVTYWDNKEGFLVDNKMNPTLKKAMQELKKSVEAFKSKKNRAPEEDLNVQEALNEIAYLFKNQEYQYENEIRLVIKDPFGYKKHLDFDPNKLATKVYIELCLIQKCISSISIGPKTPNKDDWAAYFHYYFEQLSDTEKMEKVKILISTLPYK